MSDKDDPFGLSNDAGRTRIRPMRGETPRAPSTSDAMPQRQGYDQAPGNAYRPSQPSNYGNAGGYPASQGYAQPASGGSVRIRHARAHANPLIAAFSALLELAPELERASPPAQADTLRVRLQDNLIDARDVTVGMGVALTRADQAAWMVAALLDDIVLNTPWGGHSDWPRQPLVTSLSGDVDTGTKFFDRLDELMRFANRDPQMLELAYTCLSLGFLGKYRIQGGTGSGAVLSLRTTIARMLRDNDAAQAPLSPNASGVSAPDEPRRFALPLWTIALASAAAIAAIYVGLGIQLSGKGEQLYTLASLIPPNERAEIFRPIRDTEAPPPGPIAEPILFELLPLFQAKAPAETAAALSGREDVSLTVLVVQGTNPEVFRSAKADLNAGYEALVSSIANVILENAEVIGAVTVIGHTDSVPVQSSNPFASNQGLSEARAATIARLLVEAGLPADLVKSEGKAATEPIGDNGTKSGRAQNRRVEIKIEKKA
jgi:type VI secretion system protein ImpK